MSKQGTAASPDFRTAALDPTVRTYPSAFVGSSPLHLAAIADAEKFAAFEHANVLIEGETGTGKSYVARHIHHSSPRRRATFHQVLLSSLDNNLAASDLFGHLSGSYTDARHNRAGHFVTANQGTLFLDEIGKTSREVQCKLLQAIEHREIVPVGADRPIRVDVRIIAASNVGLRTLVAAGLFLDDLASRLDTFRIRLPALRDRRDDIPALVRQFAEMRAPSCGHPLGAPRIDRAAMDTLQQAPWPRNLRQLDGVVQRLLIESIDSTEITLDHFTGDLADLLLEAPRAQPRPALEEIRHLHGENRSATATARKLGISRWTVYRALKDDD
jgi:DNA-binding NtrC family response regulator